MTRRDVTAASRVMFPAYVAVFAWIGASYMFTRDTVTDQSPALRFVDNALPLEVWGGFFVVVSALVLAGMVTGSRSIAEYGTALGAVLCLLLMAVTAVSVLHGQVAPSAPAWPALGGCACWASYRSLADGEKAARPLRNR